MHTVGSLFTGIGGIDLAFEQAGFEIIFQVEIDDYCNRVLEQHWPGMLRVPDVRNASAANLPRVDVLAGGFPCTDISLAGKGAGLAGEQSGLWFEFERLIGELSPRVVFLENVPAITIRGGPAVIAALAKMGYVGSWGVISAQDAGASHKRERWWCVAYADSGHQGRQKSRQGSQSENSSMADATGDLSRRLSIGAPAENTGLDECRQDVADATGAGLQEWHGIRSNGAQSTAIGAIARVAQSRMGGTTHGLPARLDVARPGQPQHDWEAPRTVASGSAPHRAGRLKALGNAVVPRVVYPMAVEIRQLLSGTDS